MGVPHFFFGGENERYLLAYDRTKREKKAIDRQVWVCIFQAGLILLIAFVCGFVVNAVRSMSLPL